MDGARGACPCELPQVYRCCLLLGLAVVLLQTPILQQRLASPRFSHWDQTVSKDTWVKIRLVSKEVNKLRAIVKVACR